MRSLLAVAVALPWVAWAVVRTAGLPLGYALVAAMAFTPYVALSSPVPVLIGVVLRRWAVTAMAAVAAVALALAVVPRVIAAPGDAAPGPRLVVMTSNTWFGRADTDALLRIARSHDVDVLSLQELRPGFLERLGDAAFPWRDAGATTGVLSRLPLDDGLIAVHGAPPVRIAAVHPRPPVSSAKARAWRDTLAALPGADASGDVEILAGDFNATLDHAEFRALLDRGWVDAADAAGSGLVWTWPAGRRRSLKLTIDHVLVDRRVRVERVTVVRVPGSDHRAVIASLRLPGRAATASRRPRRTR